MRLSVLRAPRRLLIALLALCAFVGIAVSTSAPAGAAARPSVTKLSDHTGSTHGGQHLTIRGHNFRNVKSVKFGKRSARSFTVVSSTKLRVTTPSHGRGTVAVQVRTGSGTSAAADSADFTYAYPPSVTKVSRSYGPTKGGTRLTISGHHFRRGMSVKFGSARGKKVTVISTTKLKVTAPKHRASLIDIRVSTAYGTSRVSRRDHYAFAARPTITSISPAVGGPSGGTRVTLHGTSFVKVKSVSFGTRRATSISNPNASTLVVTAPSHAAGSTSVYVSNPYGTSKPSAQARFVFARPGVTDLVARATGSGVVLTWTKPASDEFHEAIVRRANGATPPATPTDGVGVGSASGTTGSETVTDSSVANSTQYAYAVFAANSASDFAAPANATVTTLQNRNGPGPLLDRTSANDTADRLPTVQIAGTSADYNKAVAWSQVIIGNTVYVGGSFANAYPAGAAATAGNMTPRANLLAYDITTGNLISTFHPTTNAQVLTIARSPDGSRLYIGGDFTQVNGTTHSRIAAIDPTTGATITSFAAVAGSQVRSIVATASTVYAGGQFTSAGGRTHSRLAAFSATNGAVTAWSPSADNTVYALVLAPGGSKLVVGGTFKNLNNASACGLGAVSASTGASQTWKVAATFQDCGSTDATHSGATDTLSTDGTYVYGGGYSFGNRNPGRYEGSWSAYPTDGSLHWFEDCHGDTYGVFSNGNVVYAVSHSHDCARINGFPNDFSNEHRTLAFSTAATGVLNHYHPSGNDPDIDFGGLAAPSLYYWFPQYVIGTATGQGQAAWSVTGNSTYTVEAGEFLAVNNSSQQGLVRFAVPGTPDVPNASNNHLGRQGPRYSDDAGTPTSTNWALNCQTAVGGVTLTFNKIFDRDDLNLTYTVLRSPTGSAPSTPVYSSGPQASRFWTPTPGLTANDTTTTLGMGYDYQVVATDQLGNSASGEIASNCIGG